MKEGWSLKRLGDLCEIELGGTPSRANPHFWDTAKTTGNVWLSIADLPRGIHARAIDSKEYISDEAARNAKFVKAGTLLVSFKLTLGRLAYAGRNLCTNEAIAALYINDRSGLLKEYLYWFLTYFDWDAASEGDDKIKGRTLNKAKLMGLNVVFPPLSEQQRIVAILDEVFEGFTVAAANAEKNLKSSSELYNCAVASNIFGDPVAKGWHLSTVEALAAPGKAAIRTGPFGSQLLHGEFVDKGIAVLGIDNAVANEFRWDKRRFITAEKYKQLTRYTVKPGDVIITIMGTCGRCAVVPDDIPVAINSKHLCCISLDKDKCLPKFLHTYFLFHPVAKSFLAVRAMGSIMAGLNMAIIKELPVWLPNVPTQAEIIAKFDALSADVCAVETVYHRKIAALAELKQSILAKAFAGELT